MDPPANAAAAVVPLITAAAVPVAATTAVAPVLPPIPAANLDYEIVVSVIGILPPLLPRPSHTSIHTLKHTLFECLEQLPSHQSEEWGFCSLTKQPLEYVLKLVTPGIDMPNP